MEILPRMEIIYEDTKAVTGVEPEFKWGQIYQMIKDQTVLDVGLENIPLYVNIRKYSIKKYLHAPRFSLVRGERMDPTSSRCS